MKNSSKNIAAYVQAGLSILFILCTFTPYLYNFAFDSNFSFSYLLSNALYNNTDDEYFIFGCIYIAYFMLHAVNVFIQAHRSCITFSTLLSLAGIAGIVALHIYLDDDNAFEYAEYAAGFYLVIASLVAQLVIPELILLSGRSSVKENTDARIG